MIIGLGYKSGVGKDTCADYIAEQFGFTKVSYASSLKAIAFELFNHLGVQPADYYEGEFKEVRRKEVYGPFDMNIIEIWVFMNKLCDIDPELWITKTFSKFEDGKNYIISDVRKEVEINAIKALGGVAYWVDRDIPDKPEGKVDRYLAGKEYLFDGKIDNNSEFIKTAIQLTGIVNELDGTLE